MVEQVAVNDKVLGSSPSHGAFLMVELRFTLYDKVLGQKETFYVFRILAAEPKLDNITIVLNGS